MTGAADDSRQNARSFLILVWLFMGSGCAALIYEIVWFQLLQFVIGSSAVSLGVLLATFMGGMGLGSYLLPRWLAIERHPLKVYALLEFSIGLLALGVVHLLPLLGGWYVAAVTGSGAHGWTAIAWRAVMAAVGLLPPTILMGATLPAVARWVEASPRGTSWLGFFYGGNLAGAVLGCLLAGFYLLREFDLYIATYAAVAINLSVALASAWLARRTPFRQVATGATEPRRAVRANAVSANAGADAGASAGAAGAVQLVIALSGFSALGAEVTWTRLLSLLIGGTVYTFSIILAVFLVGLGLGSTVGAMLARRLPARPLLAICQGLLTLATFWTAYQVTCSLPYWPINPSLTHDALVQWQLDIVRCLWALLPPAVLWGASFPLALAAVAAARRHRMHLPPPHDAAFSTASATASGTAGDTLIAAGDGARVAGDVSAANTFGAILGALLFSLLLIPGIGTQNCQRLLIVLSASGATVLALVELVARMRSGQPYRSLPAVPPSGAEQAAGASWRLAGWMSCSLLVIAAAVALSTWLIRHVPATPADLIAYGRYSARYRGEAEVLYLGEGLNSSVAVTLRNGLQRSFHVSGKVEASSVPQDMRLQRMLGHIPALVHPAPKSVLIVGCGAGVTAGSFLLHPTIERIVICELEPLIPQVVAHHFDAENHGVVTNPKVEIVYDDARHFILTTTEQFDIITSDPIHPWVRGAAALYTREYFELCKRRLKPGGVVTQWVPLYESNLPAVQSELATFFDAFPQGTVWSNDQYGSGYDVVLLGQNDPLVINLDDWNERLAREDHWFIAFVLEDVGFYSTYDLLATYAGRASDLANWLAKAERNHDRNLRLQYLAAVGANEYQEDGIYRAIVKHRSATSHPFVGSTSALNELKHRWAHPSQNPMRNPSRNSSRNSLSPSSEPAPADNDE